MIKAHRKNGEYFDSLSPHTPKRDIPIWSVSNKITAIITIVIRQTACTIHFSFCQPELF